MLETDANTNIKDVTTTLMENIEFVEEVTDEDRKKTDELPLSFEEFLKRKHQEEDTNQNDEEIIEYVNSTINPIFM